MDVGRRKGKAVAQGLARRDGDLVGELALDVSSEFSSSASKPMGKYAPFSMKSCAPRSHPSWLYLEVVDVEGVHPRVERLCPRRPPRTNRNETADVFLLDGRRLGVVTHQVQAIVMFTSLEAL